MHTCSLQSEYPILERTADVPAPARDVLDDTHVFKDGFGGRESNKQVYWS